MNVPIIKLEIDSMKHTLLTMLYEHSFKMDEMVNEAVTRFCTDDNLKRIIDEAVKEHLNTAVREEVRSFFWHSGAGRQAVREAVINYLNTSDAAFKEVYGDGT